MKKNYTILAIESSCDETSCAVVVDGRTVLSNVVSSQIDIHTLFGGVVPEVASRNHITAIDNVVNEALKVANKTLDDMSVEELKAYAKANSMKLTSKVKSKMIQQILDYEKARGSHGRLFRVYEANRYFV